MKNQHKTGRSARRGNSASPYTKRGKHPYPCPGDNRLASGELKSAANDRPGNKYK